MAVGIVDALEEIDVEIEQRKGALALRRTFDGCLQRQLELAPVRDARQRIGVGQRVQVAFVHARGGGVGRQDVHAHHFAIAQMRQEGRVDDADVLLAHDVMLALRGLAQPGVVQRFLLLQIEIFAEGFDHGLADDLVGRLAQPRLVHRIGEHVAVILVEVRDQDRQVVGNRAQALFAVGQAVARCLQFGDVLHRHDRAEGLALGAAQRAAAGQQRVRRAAGRCDDHRAVAHDFALECAHQRHVVHRHRGLAVAVVQRVEQWPFRGRDRLQVVTMQGARRAVEQRQVADGVAGDHADVDRFEHRVDQFLFFFQLLLRADALRDVIDEGADVTRAIPFVGRHRHLDRDLAPALGQRRQFDVLVQVRAGAGIEQAADVRVMRFALLRRHDQIGQLAAARVLARPAKDAFGRRVPRHHHAVAVGTDEAAERRIDDRAVPGFALAQQRFGRFALRDFVRQLRDLVFQFGSARDDARFQIGIERLERLLGEHARGDRLQVIDFDFDQPGQVGQHLALLLVQAARRAVDDAQRAHGFAIAVDRMPGVEADVRLAGHQRILGKAGILRRVLDHEQRARLHRVAAERQRARGFRHVQAMVRLEPLPLRIDQRHQRNRHVERHGGQAGKAVEAGLGRGVENLQFGQRSKAGLFN